MPNERIENWENLGNNQKTSTFDFLEAKRIEKLSEGLYVLTEVFWLLLCENQALESFTYGVKRPLVSHFQ